MSQLGDPLQQAHCLAPHHHRARRAPRVPHQLSQESIRDALIHDARIHDAGIHDARIHDAPIHM